jgi:hypothetical protein
MNKFFILGLPRSRTAWLAEYFNCVHEGLFYYPDYQDFMYSNHKGDSTTVYHLIKDHIQDHKKVFIHRPLNQVAASLYKAFGWCPDELDWWDAELKAGDGLHIHFDDINDSLEGICQYLGVEYDQSRDYLTAHNIQNERLMEEVRKCH